LIETNSKIIKLVGNAFKIYSKRNPHEEHINAKTSLEGFESWIFSDVGGPHARNGFQCWEPKSLNWKPTSD
jgi:hypothetical protein